MKVFYTFSYLELDKHYKKYQAGIDLIKKEGHELTREWLNDAVKRMKAGKEQKSRASMYTELTQSILKSDVCIFDISARAVEVGQLSMFAITNKRPTLVINNVNFSNSVKCLFMSGSKSTFLTMKDYKTEAEMKRHIKQFLKTAAKPKKARLTFYLEKPLYDRLIERSKELGKTKSETVEYLIREKQKELMKKK